MSVGDWSATADYNTSIDGINIAEGCAPGNLNNAIRSVMAGVASALSTFWLTILGTTTSAQALTALGAAASGANADITSLDAACEATTQAAADNSTKLATTAYADRASIGTTQTWQNKLSARAIGTLYTNATSKPIMVSLWFSAAASFAVSGVFVGGVQIASSYLSSNSNTLQSPYAFIVPAGATYEVTVSGSATLGGWVELTT